MRKARLWENEWQKKPEIINLKKKPNLRKQDNDTMVMIIEIEKVRSNEIKKIAYKVS
jgi:hypothetical protein